MRRSVLLTFAVLALAAGCGDDASDPLGVEAVDPGQTGLETVPSQPGTEPIGTASFAVGQAAGGATLTTDKDDYAPGDTVRMTGAGWEPGETVDMDVSEDPADPDHPPFTLSSVADEAGRFLHDKFVIDVRHIGVTFTVTATGQQSGQTLQVVFTDGNIMARTNGVTVSVEWRRYSNRTCSAAGGSQIGSGSATITSSNNIITFANAGQSLQLTAPSSASGQPFESWKSGNDVRTTRVICVEGSNNTQNWELHYSAAAPATTTTSVTADKASPQQAGTSVQFTAEVKAGSSAVTSGSVTLYDGGTCTTPGPQLQAATALNSSGKVSYTTSSLSTGDHTILACYGGATGFASSSGTLSFSISAAIAATSVSSVSGTGIAGGTATLTATLKAGTAALSGKTVSFKLNGTSAGTAQTDANGVATRESVSLGSIAAGSYTDAVEATFAGDPSFSGSSAKGTLTVSPPAPAKLAFTTGPVSIGRSDCSDAITVQTQTAAGAAANPTASVTVNLTSTATAGRFYSDASCATAVNNVTIATSANSASFYYKDSARGTPTLTAADAAASNPLASAQLGVTVSDVETATALSTSDASANYGDEVEFTATVKRKSSNTAVTEGSVTFKFGGTSCSDATGLGSAVALSATGTARLKTKTLGAGTHNVRACYGGEGSYADSDNAVAQAVAKKALSVTVEDKSREYGLDNPSFGGTLQGVVAGDGVTAQYATQATKATSVGQYAITVALSDPDNKLGNYTVPSPLPEGVLTITPAPLTVSVNNPPSRTYGEENPDLTGGITGIRNNDRISLDYTTTATQSSDVGEYAIDVTISDPDNRVANYAVSPNPLPKGKLTVTPAPLTVTAQDKSKVYDGQAFSPFTVDYSGFVLGQGPSVLGGTLGFGGSAAGAVNAGSYTITPSGLTSANYAITFADGTLTVAPRPISVRAKDAGTVDYGDHLPSFSWEIVSGDFIGSDQTVFAGAITYQLSSTAAPLPVGTHTVTPRWSTYSNGNYGISLATPGTGSLTVRPWTPKGFYQPTDMSGSATVYNTVKAGSTVPLKFEVFKGAAGALAELRELSVAKPLFTKAVSCTSGSTDEIEMLATGGTTLRFDATSDQFIYNWQTPRQAGTCYLVTLTTADGSDLKAYFRLK